MSGASSLFASPNAYDGTNHTHRSMALRPDCRQTGTDLACLSCALVLCKLRNCQLAGIAACRCSQHHLCLGTCHSLYCMDDLSLLVDQSVLWPFAVFQRHPT